MYVFLWPRRHDNPSDPTVRHVLNCVKHGAEATAAPQLGAHFISTLKLAGSCTLQAATFLRVLLRLLLRLRLHFHFRRRLFWPEKLSCACVYTLHLSGHLINDAYVSGHVCYGSPSSCCCCCVAVVVVAIPWHFHYIHCHLPLKERALPFGF